MTAAVTCVNSSRTRQMAAMEWNQAAIRAAQAAALGRDEIAAAIHGGVRREDRRMVKDAFRQDPALAVLVATDAAGEGLSLQRAHLMVNHDLPWNPNRIERRFGPIHRIGQTEVCHLWNLVATSTREGDVFDRLLAKVGEQRQALGGKVFDVLGEAFSGAPLRKLLLDAIRYGDRPEVRARLHEVIDERVGEGLDRLLAERALYQDLLTAADVEQVRLQMEEARARRLQPHYISAFFRAAFTGLGGRVSPREAGRYEISGVPPVPRERRQAGGSVLSRYQRVTFDREGIQPDPDGDGHPLIRADLLAPGHPLLDAVVQHTAARCTQAVAAGAILLDRLDPAEDPRVMVALRQEIADGNDPPRPVLRRFEFAELLAPGHDPGGPTPQEIAAEARACGPAPYLDYEIPQDSERDAVAALAAEPRLTTARHTAVSRAASTLLPASLAEVSERITTNVERTRRLVRQRLTHEINYWDARQGELFWQQQHGKKIRMRPETAGAKARDLERRLAARLAELDREQHLQPSPPVAAAAARRFTQFYAEHRREFPSHVSEAEYERRIRDCYPLHPELFDRLYDDAAREVLNSITGEQEGFALATGRDEATGSFSGLALPQHGIWFSPITDAVLLVRPDIALAQCEAQVPTSTGGGVTAGGPAGTGETGKSPGPEAGPEPGPSAKTRYFGVLRVDAEKYGRDLTRLQQEILPHLADPEAGELTITVEVEATRPDGFPEDKIRILTENARVLKFERSEFE